MSYQPDERNNKLAGGVPNNINNLNADVNNSVANKNAPTSVLDILDLEF